MMSRSRSCLICGSSDGYDGGVVDGDDSDEEADVADDG